MTKDNRQRKRESSDAALLKVKERIDHVSRKRPSHKAAITFFEGVITEKIRAKARVDVESIDMDRALLEIKNKEGFPLVDKRDLKLDIPSAAALFKRLCEQLQKNEKVSHDVGRIMEAVDSGKLDLEELFKKAGAEDHEYMVDLSDRLKLQKGVLFFVAENSLQPLYEVYADKLKDYVDQEKWWRSYCPICGSKPVMAELIGRKRKKFLICSCCGYEWRYKRTRCPFCESDGGKGLKYFFTEKEGRAYRVETCQKCKKYIKTVDTDEINEEVIPSVEDISTLYLDVLAQKEGYTREVHPLGLNLGDL